MARPKAKCDLDAWAMHVTCRTVVRFIFGVVVVEQERRDLVSAAPTAQLLARVPLTSQRLKPSHGVSNTNPFIPALKVTTGDTHGEVGGWQ